MRNKVLAEFSLICSLLSSLPRICAGQMRLFTIQLNFLVYLKDLEHVPIRLIFICTQTSSFDWLNVIFG